MLTGRVAYRFRALFPKVFLRIAEGTTFQMRELVSRGEADVGLISRVEPDGDFVLLAALDRTPVFGGPREATAAFRSADRCGRDRPGAAHRDALAE